MQQFNPWFFTNNPQQAWPFSAMHQTDPHMNQFMPGGFTNWTQMAQTWQHQIDQFNRIWQTQSTMPDFNPSTIPPFSEPLSKANETLTRITLEFIQRLTANATDNNTIKQAAIDYAQRIFQISWYSTTGIPSTEMANSTFHMMRSSLQWIVDNFANLPHANSNEQRQYIDTLHIWIDFADAATAMLIRYEDFSKTAKHSFAEALTEKIGTSSDILTDDKRLLTWFIDHYEHAFTTWLQSEEYSKTYGTFVNACSALRIDQQKYIDRYVEALGLPSKQEMDTTHQRAHDHTRKLRQYEQQLNNNEQYRDQQINTLKQELIQLTNQLKNTSEQVTRLTGLHKINQNELDRLRRALFKQQFIIPTATANVGNNFQEDTHSQENKITEITKDDYIRFVSKVCSTATAITYMRSIRRLERIEGPVFNSYSVDQLKTLRIRLLENGDLHDFNMRTSKGSPSPAIGYLIELRELLTSIQN